MRALLATALLAAAAAAAASPADAWTAAPFTADAFAPKATTPAAAADADAAADLALTATSTERPTDAAGAAGAEVVDPGSLLAGVGGAEEGGGTLAGAEVPLPAAAEEALPPAAAAALTADEPLALPAHSEPPVGDLPPSEEEVVVASPPETPAAEGEVEEAAAAPSDAEPAASSAPDAEEVADEAAARLASVGTVAPDLLSRFKAAFVSAEEGGGGGGAFGGFVPRFAALLGRGGAAGGRGGAPAAGGDPAWLLGSLLGGGGGGLGGGDDGAAQAAPPTPDDATNSTGTAGPAPATGGEAALALHNALRARHVDTPPLTWSPSIAAAAARHAARCVFAHSASANGENIAMGHKSWAEAVAAWYDEAPAGLNHRSQVVWRGSAELGCGAAACGRGLGGGGTFYCCQYSPAGNVVGNARANVMPLKAGA